MSAGRSPDCFYVYRGEKDSSTLFLSRERNSFDRLSFVPSSSETAATARAGREQGPAPDFHSMQQHGDQGNDRWIDPIPNSVAEEGQQTYEPVRSGSWGSDRLPGGSRRRVDVQSLSHGCQRSPPVFCCHPHCIELRSKAVMTASSRVREKSDVDSAVMSGSPRGSLPMRRDGRRSVPGPKGATPLYGQPNWWGSRDDEEAGSPEHLQRTNSKVDPILRTRSEEEEIPVAISTSDEARPKVAPLTKREVTKNFGSPERLQDRLPNDDVKAGAGETEEVKEDVVPLPATPACAISPRTARPSSARRQWNKLESYDRVVLSSVLALSEKLKRCSEVAARKVQ